MSDFAIRVENLGKQYRIGALQKAGGRHTYKSLRDSITDAASLPLRAARRLVGQGEPAGNGHDETFWALKDVSFDIKHGEIVGVIGRNGAGKSTLLKLLSRITEPTTGRVEIHGRVGSLLEVGTGFHPELSGRDNVYMNGAILGMKRAEIARQFDEIVAFAEVEKFIDTPVKHYSSGMYLRLAFAVAAHLQTEILVVDEVLAVGDAEFQKRCMGKMQGIAENEGRTVLFVSHNIGAILSLCPKVAWIERGQLRGAGASRGIVNEYLTKQVTDVSATVDLESCRRSPGEGSRVRLERLEWITPLPLQHGEPLTARLRLRVNGRVENLLVGLGFSSLTGTRLLTYDSALPGGEQPAILNSGIYSVEIAVESLPLGPAIYLLDIGCLSGDNFGLDYLPAVLQLEVVPGPKTPGHIVRQDAGVRLSSRWDWS